MCDVAPDETLYTDYKDEKRSQATNIKLKSTTERIQMWIVAHKYYHRDKCFDYTKEDLVTSRHKEKNKNLIVKFHLTTGVILIQGSRFREWQANMFNVLKARVDELCVSNAAMGLWVEDDDVTDPKSIADADIAEDDYADSVDMADTENEGEGDMAPEQVQYHNVNHSNQHSQFDPIRKLEEAYIRMVDTNSENINVLKFELNEINSEVRKIPVKIYDHIKKDLQHNAKAIYDLTAKLAENESLKTQLHQLTIQLQNTGQEIWSLQQELSMIRAANCAGNRRSPTPLSGDMVIPRPPNPESREPARNPPVLQAGVGIRTPGTVTTTTPASSNSHPLDEGRQRRVTTHTVSRPVEARQVTSCPRPLPRHNDDRNDEASNSPLASRPPVISSPSAGNVPRGNGTMVPTPERQTSHPTPPKLTSNDALSLGETASAFASGRRNPTDAEAILIGDSTTKHIDKDKFMGYRSFQLHRSSTSISARNAIINIAPSNSIKFGVLHVGVNDVRDGSIPDETVENIERCLTDLKNKFPNAKVAFTEILYVGAENSLQT